MVGPKWRCVLRSFSPPGSESVDVAVVGAGFGGLGAALRAAELGHSVALFETLAYPGGCASTFKRGGAHFEAGATLFAGLSEQGFLRRALLAHGFSLPVRLLDPVLHVRTPDFVLDVPADRDAFVERWVELEPHHAASVRRFFATQRELAQALWAIFENPALLLPFDPRALLVHLKSAMGYAPLLRWIGRPLGAMLDAYGLRGARRLRSYLDSLCQITVQTTADEAETAFALAAIDYPFRATGHVEGGIGTLAQMMVDASLHAGAEVRFTDRVHAVRREGTGYRIQSRRGETFARHLVLDVLPSAAAGLFSIPLAEHRELARLDAAIRTGWGAAMLYRIVRDDGLLSPHAHHVDLTSTPGAAPISGHHVFCSVSGADENRAGKPGLRTLTASTHVRIPMTGEAVAEVQARMRQTIEAGYPALARATVREMTASPRTFARFVGRPEGYVGGVPRRAGLHNYRALSPRPVLEGAWLVGDTSFPGQSVLAATLGGWKTAEAIPKQGQR